MSKSHSIYLVQNQDKLFLSKQSGWVDGRDLGCLYKTRYKDEALNEIVEVNSKDVNQRIHLLECDATKSGMPILDPDLMPPPLPTAEPTSDREIDNNSTNDETTATEARVIEQLHEHDTLATID